MSAGTVDQDAAGREVARRALTDVAFFARVLVGRELWAHQLEVALSPARYRVVCAGRQVGKSVLLALLALWHAYRKPGQLVLIVSAGETASKRLLADVAAMATSSALLRGAVVDDNASVVTLSNGSSIRSVPASQAQIRGWAVDLLIVDEAAFIDPEIWRAAEPAIIARPGSRVILSSSPFGSSSHFFRLLFRRGMTSPDEQVAAWHWPSSTSPLVDAELLEEIRQRENPVYFRREYLAEWTDGAGVYFTDDEVMGAVADYEMIDPAQARSQLVVGGIDWGMRDANTLVLLGVLEDGALNDHVSKVDPVFFVAHLEEHFDMRYADFIDRIVDVAREPEGFHVYTAASETNGVGAMPTETLTDRAWRAGTRMWVSPVHTDNRFKESAFGAIKGLLQMGRLVLPRHPELLRQLAAVEYTTTDSGSTRLAVPDNVGHDDLVMALAQAVACLEPSVGSRPQLGFGEGLPGGDDVLETPSGTRIPRRPKCAHFTNAFNAPRGRDRGPAQW